MNKRIIEDVVSKEIDRHYSNVFTEFKTEILLAEDKIATIYLSPLRRDIFVRHDDTKDKVISYGHRKINLEVSSLNFSDPIIPSWLENGFEFFIKLGEKGIELESKKEKDIVGLIKEFEEREGKRLCCGYSDTPYLLISDDINSVKKFINSYKGEINLDEAILRNYNYHNSRELHLNITKKLFSFESLGTNLDAKKYAKMVDEFLGD